MIKLCGNSICKPLLIIFNDCLNEGKFPHEWQKDSVVPVHKKGNKKGLKTICQSLYSLFVAEFLSVSFITKCLAFFTENNLISPNQSGFRPGDSCVNQLLAIKHKIYKSLDKGFEVRGVFLDISKAFNKIWHEGLLLKLNQNGISRNLLKLLCDILSCQKQRVVLNVQHSSWDNITTGVPQGSTFEPLFLIYINNLSNDLSPNCKLFGDNTSLFSVVNNIHTGATTLSQDINAITNWAFRWKMIFNPDLSKQAEEVIFNRKIKKLLYPTLLFNNIPLSNSLFKKHLV